MDYFTPTEPPTQFIYPTDKQLILALIAAVSSHPWVVNHSVYYPRILADVQAGKSPEKVGIVNYRDTGGTELLEPGLTLAVYPFHSSYSNLKGSLNSSKSQKTVSFEAYTLGSPMDSTYAEVAKFRVVLQLFYLDASFNEPIDLLFYKAALLNPEQLDQGREVKYVDDQDGDTGGVINPLYAPPSYVNYTRNVIRIRTFPGEHVLRDWMPILRSVIRNISSLKPYAVRRPQILAVDYPSSNWLKNPEHLIFHTAYMIVEYDMYEPPGAQDYLFPKPDLNITAEDSIYGYQTHPVPDQPDP